MTLAADGRKRGRAELRLYTALWWGVGGGWAVAKGEEVATDSA